MIPAWLRCLERLEAEFPAEEVHTWLKPLQAEAGDDGLCLFAPTRLWSRRFVIATWIGSARWSVTLPAARLRCICKWERCAGLWSPRNPRCRADRGQQPPEIGR